MSMWLDVVVMKEAAFEAVKKDDDLLGDVFQQEASVLKKLGIAKSDMSGCDYLSMDAAIPVAAIHDDVTVQVVNPAPAEGAARQEGSPRVHRSC